MSKAGVNRNLPNNAYEAATGANNPNGTNVYATLADLFQQDGLIDGSAVWSGSGFIYDVTNLVYRIGGVLYTATATQVTLTAADPTLDRIDIIVVDTAGVISVKTGVPAPAPVAQPLDVDEVLVATVFVGAGTTAPVINIEALYDENAGSPTEWVGTSDDLNVTFASVADPNTGTVSIETTSPLGSNKYIQLAKGSPYTIVSGSVDFYIKAKQTMSTPSGQLYIGFYVAGSLVGNSVYIGGSPANIYGFDPTNTSTYQLVSIPITAFGVLPTTVDAIRFFKGPGSTTAEFFLDSIEIQEGAVAPPVSPILPSLTEDYIWIGDATNTPVEALLSSLIPPAVDGSGTTNYIPKWTPDGDTLGDSPLLVGAAGYNLGHGATPLGLTMYYINTLPLTGFTSTHTGIDLRALIATAVVNRGMILQSNFATNRNTGYEAIVGQGAASPTNVGADFAVGSSGGCPIPINDNDAALFRVLGVLADIDANNLGPALGAYLCNIQSNAFDNVGLMVNVANAGAGGAYIGLLKDGNEGAGKVLTSDANGYASWQTPAGGGGGSGVNWIPMFSGGLFATNQTFYSNWEEATGVQANVETPFPAGTLNAFKINCNSNSANNPTVIDVMRGGVVLISVTIPGLTTGIFEATGSVAIANNDLLYIRVTIPAGGPSIGLRGGLLSITV
jgi:hypothetical protein